VLPPRKPVVLTGAMRPATSSEADGPRNLAEAIAVASQSALAARPGVVVAFAGSVFAAAEVRKMHPARLEAFGAGDAGPVGRFEAGRLRPLRTWPNGASIGLAALPAAEADWPFVAVVASGAGVDARQVRALTAAGCRGIVVAGTGNGSLHRELETALRQAMADGVSVLRSTRCIEGGIAESEERAREGLPSAGSLTPAQARVELIVRLLDPERCA
jgi:L-asparaginase